MPAARASRINRWILLAGRVSGEVGRFERDHSLDVSVLGQIDRTHRAFAESPNNPVTAELAGEPGFRRLSGLLRDRLRSDGFLAVRDERFGRVVRTIERGVCSSQFRYFVWALMNDRTWSAIGACRRRNCSRSTASPRSIRSR